MADVDVLIVGAGPAGSACAETLRAEGFDGSILLAGREPDAPYDRPPCSKSYLRGVTSRSEHALYPDSFWDDEDIDLRTRTSVMKLDAAERVATLATKEELRFERALLATGANVRRLRVDGGDLDGIHYLRAFGNSDSIRADAQAGDRVVLVGGSYIACEVAASLTALGKSCTLLMLEDRPLSTGFGERAGAFFEDLLRSKGIDVHGGQALAGFEGDEGTDDAPGRVRRVQTESGLALDADLVVMGTGAVPDVMLARSAGLALGDGGGVACSATLETSAAGVWAAGDICEFESEVFGRPLRIEHWEVARAQGAFAARSMLGATEPYREIPYFWSDLADWLSLEYVGAARGGEEEVVRGSIDDGEFTIFYLDGGRVVAAMTVGRSGDLDLARELIAAGTDVSARTAVLADVDATAA